MGTRITIRGPVAVVDAASRPVRDAKRLKRYDGLAPVGDSMLDHLDGPLDDIGLAGGGLVLAHGAKGLAVETEWTAPRALRPKERRELVEYTTGQWSDGVGESIAGELAERFGLEVDLLPDPDRVKVTEKAAKVAAPRGGGGAKLLAAVKAGKLAEVVTLLDGGADLEARNKWKQTSLVVAIFEGHPALARLLLERGADPHALGEEGTRPLHAAAMVGPIEVVEALLARGARADEKDERGMTPRDWAISREQNAIAARLARKPR